VFGAFHWVAKIQKEKGEMKKAPPERRGFSDPENVSVIDDDLFRCYSVRVFYAHKIASDCLTREINILSAVGITVF
jgi:hypothetical protein